MLQYLIDSDSYLCLFEKSIAAPIWGGGGINSEFVSIFHGVISKINGTERPTRYYYPLRDHVISTNN